MRQPIKHALQVTAEPHTFSARDFVGGHPSLDFVNTVTGRDQSPRDWLDSYARLTDWAAQASLFPRDVLQQITREAKRNPAEANRALARAKTQREQLFTLLTHCIAGGGPSDDALRSLRKHWLEGANSIDLRFVGGRIFKQFRGKIDLDSIATRIVYRLVEDVLTSPIERLRMCQGPNCSWLFIDSSKAGRRRWCDMAVCGNAAKSRRFYQRSGGDGRVHSS
jgi:predicted RNA-binding Zn ribbon-like protein